MEENRKISAKKPYWKTPAGRKLLIAGILIAVLQAGLTAAFLVQLQTMGMVPANYKFLGSVFLVLCVLVTLLLQYKKIPGIIGKILGILMILALSAGIFYMYKTREALMQMTGENLETHVIGIYVRKDSTYQNLEDLTGQSCAYIEDQTTDSVEDLMAKLDSQNLNLQYQTAPSFLPLIDSLRDSKVEAILMNPAYLEVAADLEGYRDVADELRLLTTEEYVTVVEPEPESTEAAAAEEPKEDHTITFYISGIDTDGSAIINTRSDVNIILSMNTETHEILMINTPRDFYVPLPNSHGVCDKLTHAGIYGTKVSMGTLEMLYDTTIDYYVKVNFVGFKRIIDALGGVDIDLDYTRTLSSGLSVHKGSNHFNGEEALKFARERHSYVDGDDQRGKNQMMVIEACIQKMCTPAILSNYSEVMAAVSKSIVTSAPYDLITSLVEEQLSSMPTWHVQTYAVSGEGASKTTFSMPDFRAYVTIPDESTVTRAKDYLDRLEAGESFTIE